MARYRPGLIYASIRTKNETKDERKETHRCWAGGQVSKPRTICLRVERVGSSSVLSKGLGTCVDEDGEGEGDDKFVVDDAWLSFLRFFG